MFAINPWLAAAGLAATAAVGGGGSGGSTGVTEKTVRIDSLSDTGPDGDGITAHNRPNFTGTGEPGGNVEITLPDGTAIIANIGADGSWTASFPEGALSLPNGTNDLQVKFTAPTGNSTIGSLLIDIQAPIVNINKFDGSWESLPGFINAAEQNNVTISGTTGNAAVGDTVTILVYGTSGTLSLTAQVEADGSWFSQANISSLPEGVVTARATLTTTTIEGTVITSLPHTRDSVKDTVGHTVVITQNVSTLNGAATIAGSKDDDKLNIAEARNGISYTLTFDTAVETLTAADLNIIGGGTVRGTPSANAAKTVWTVVVDPTPSNTGSLDLRLKDAKLITLTDTAGNPATATNTTIVSYDMDAPLITFTNPNGINTGSSTDLVLEGAAIFVLDGNEAASNYTIGLTKAVPTDTITQVSFEGLGSASLTNQSTVTLNQAPLGALAQGFYSLEVRAVDAAGNTSVSHQIIGKNTGGFPSTGLVSTLSSNNALTGDNNDNFFINRAGVYETMTLGGAADRDTVFVLKTGLGTMGTPDQLTINDFNIGAGMDKLRLDDLFSGSATHNQIRFEGQDLDSNGTLESTRIYVNTAGGLVGSTAATLTSTAEQIITLANVAVPSQTISNLNADIARPDWLIL